MPDGVQGQGLEPAEPLYRAFISYSHQDKGLAARLHREIESFRIPAKLVGKITPIGEVPRRLTPIFRDREELSASPDVGTALTDALRKSMFLVVICSPSGARSHWVHEEILSFKRMHGEGRVLALVVDGTPNASDHDPDSPDECFPKSLRYLLGPDGELSDVRAEPLAADLRPHADGPRLARLKLVAGLTGLRLDDLVQREAQRRAERLAWIASAATVGMVLTGGLAVYANQQRIEANKKEAEAKAVSEFLVNTFRNSNPGKVNPRAITALNILEGSADRARNELKSQPEVQAQLFAVLGRAYNNLGLFPEARAALEPSVPQLQAVGPEGAQALLQLATTYAKQGELQGALKMVTRAESLLGPDQGKHVEERGDAAALRGRILTSASDVKAGIAAFDQALAFYNAAPNADPTDKARVLNNKGLLLSDDGQFKAADQSLQQSLDIYRHYAGETELRTGQAWYALAQNSMQAHDVAHVEDLPAAQVQIGNALAIERRVLEPDNPILADSLRLQGQIQQGLHKLADAERSLREAIAIYRKAFGGPHFLIGIADVYLALIQSDRGDTRAPWPRSTTPKRTTTSATASCTPITATCWSTAPGCWPRRAGSGRRRPTARRGSTSSGRPWARKPASPRARRPPATASRRPARAAASALG
jgi:tetratricopeptide (TPR) repeat protein